MTLDLAGAVVVFDLDGTLVDTAPDLVRALNHVMALEGLPPAPLEDVRAMVGHGAAALIERGAARAGAVLTPERVSALKDAFIAVYAEDVAGGSVVFAGVQDALATLRAAGARLTVCTNKPAMLARPLLDALRLSPFFEGLVGPEDVSARKPDAAHYRAAVALAGGRTEQSVMVGDSAPDVLSARNAGAAGVIVAAFGYSTIPVESLGADLVLEAYEELPAAVGQLLRRARR
jgi:phosphoglycolate phosphatase